MTPRTADRIGKGEAIGAKMAKAAILTTRASLLAEEIAALIGGWTPPRRSPPGSASRCKPSLQSWTTSHRPYRQPATGPTKAEDAGGAKSSA